MQEIRAPIECTAGDNLRWGYCRIQGKLKKLGHGFARPAIAKTLKDHGVPPSGRRATSWRRFFRAQEDTIAATDYFTAEVWTKRGLVTHYILFVIDHATRAVEITGCTTRSDAAFMAQFARDLADLADLEDGVLRRKSFLVLDRDSTFAAQFHRILGDAGVTTFHTAFQAPNMKAIDERFINSIKRECLDRLILLGKGHLQRALREYVAHYNTERPHQGIGNELIEPPATTHSELTGSNVEHKRLNRLLRSYSRAD